MDVCNDNWCFRAHQCHVATAQSPSDPWRFVRRSTWSNRPEQPSMTCIGPHACLHTQNAWRPAGEMGDRSWYGRVEVSPPPAASTLTDGWSFLIIIFTNCFLVFHWYFLVWSLQKQNWMNPSVTFPSAFLKLLSNLLWNWGFCTRITIL